MIPSVTQHIVFCKTLNHNILCFSLKILPASNCLCSFYVLPDQPQTAPASLSGTGRPPTAETALAPLDAEGLHPNRLSFPVVQS